MARTKLTYIIGSLASGGAERQLLQLLSHIDRSRYQLLLVLFENSTVQNAKDLVDEIFSLGIDSRFSRRKSRFRGIRASASVFRLARYFQQTRPDIVHAILPASCILAAPAAKLARVPVVIGGRRSMINGYRSGGIQDWVDQIATRMCDFVVTNSKSSAREVIEIDGVPDSRVTTIYNGIDTKRFRPRSRELRNRYGWSEEHVVFGIVANFIPYKRHTDFIRAAGIIAELHANARFLMVGEDRGILQPLRQQIHESGLERLFTVIPGSREPELLYPVLDVYICTSETEGLSNVLLEAGACGLPIIATRVGGNEEIVNEGFNGFLVPVASPESVAVKAAQLYSNPELRRLMGDRSRRKIAFEFSILSMVAAHEALYERLLRTRQKLARAADADARVCLPTSRVSD